MRTATDRILRAAAEATANERDELATVEAFDDDGLFYVYTAEPGQPARRRKTKPPEPTPLEAPK